MVLVLLAAARGAGGQVGAVDDDVLVDALGADEGQVGLAEELVLGPQRERLGDAGGGGEGPRAVRAGLRRRAQALGELERAPRAGVGQDDGELVAPDAVGEVGAAAGGPDRVGQRLQALVAGLVAVASLTDFRSSTSTMTSASGVPVRATTCSSRAMSSWKARWLRSPVSGSVMAISARRSTSAARAASRRRP